MRVFIDEGPPMAALLSRLIQDSQNEGVRSVPNGSPDGYAGSLLERFALETPPSGNGGSRDTPAIGIEPLSDRETEELRARRQRSHERPDRRRTLPLRGHLLKPHVHHIFGKLLVRNRSQAVARARELHLLVVAGEVGSPNGSASSLLGSTSSR